MGTIFDAMGLTKEDVLFLVNVADSDGSGDVDYVEFADLMVRLKSADVKSMVMMVRQDISQLRNQMRASYRHRESSEALDMSTATMDMSTATVDLSRSTLDLPR